MSELKSYPFSIGYFFKKVLFSGFLKKTSFSISCFLKSALFSGFPKRTLFSIGCLKKITLSFIGAAVLSTSAYAATWNCNYLYISGSSIMSFNPANGAINTQDVGYGAATIALGPVAGNMNMLRMRYWNYGGGTIYYSDSGATSWTNSGLSSDFLGTSLTNGGEINQLTAEIYITGAASNDDAYTGTSTSSTGSFRIGVYSPPYGTANRRVSPVITPGISYAVASDMAIDADGNAYILARYSGTSYSLIRINMKDQNGNFLPTPWYGTAIKTGIILSSASSYSGIWGMAFLNGKLYFTRSDDLYSLDPLTGAVATVRTDLPGSSPYDLASCQVAPIVRGTVYNDADGDGVISGSEAGISGLTVQLYSAAGSLLSTATTATDGTYSFIINNSNNADFYIRVKQPSINGIHAAQTWASGGTFTDRDSKINTVYNYCTDFTNDDTTGSSQNRTCYGARADGVDGAANGIAGVANYYSRVHVTTSLAVSRADFAFSTASDRSDSNINEVLHNTAIKTTGNSLRAYLGANVSTDAASIQSQTADSDSYDDGLYVLLNGRYVPVQQRGFVQNRNYNFRANINGSKKSDAKLSVFQTPQTSVSWSSLGAADLTGSGNYITFTGALTAAPGANSIIRARYSTSAGLTATANASTNAADPWVLDGEVEDYQVYVVDRQIKLALKTVGTSGNSGNLTFTMTNMHTTSPSSASAVISTDAPDVVTDEPIGKTHRINTANSPVSITVDKPQNLGIITSETTCVDLTDSSNVPLTFSRYQSGGKWYDNVTIAATSVKADSDIACTFAYGVAPAINVTANITLRAFANDQFNLSIADTNASSILTSNVSTGTNTAVSVSTVLAADHNNTVSVSMAGGSTSPLSRYALVAICDGVQQTVTNGAFSVSPTFGQTVNCSVTVSTSSVHTGYSGIVVIPHSNVVGNSSLVLITLKDANNVTIPSGGDNVTVFIASQSTNGASRLSNGTHTVTDGVNIRAIDHHNGSYSLNLTSNSTGNGTISFYVNGVLSANGGAYQFYAEEPDVNSTNTTIQIPSPNVGVSQNATAWIRVVDKYNNPVTNATVALYTVSTTTGGSPVLYNANVHNFNNGTYNVNLTSVLQGNVTVGMSINQVTVNPAGQYKNATARFLATNYNATGNYTTIKAEPNSTNAGNTSLVTVYLADNDNNSIDGRNVIIYVNSTNAANAIITPTPATGLGGGLYSATLTSNVSDNYTVTFRVDSNISNKSANVLFTVNPPKLDNKTLSYIDATNVVPAGSNSTIKVYLADEYNNSIKNATVSVRVLENDSGSFVPAGSNNSIAYTADSSDPKGGYYRVIYSTVTAHNVTFGFSANGVLAPESNNDTTTFTSGDVDLTHVNTTFAVTPHETDIEKNVTLRVHLVDNLSNVRASENVTFVVVGATFENGTAASLATINLIGSVTNHGNGTYTQNASTSVAQNVTFSFEVEGIGDGVSVGKTDWAKFKSAGWDISHVNTTITATQSVEVNSNSTVTVTLVDNKNNPVNNESVTIVRLSGAGGTFYPADAIVTQDGTGNGKYTARFTTPTAGNVTFGFVVGGNSNNSKNASTIFRSGQPNSTTSELTFNPPTASVSVEENYTVIAAIKDKDNNPISGTTVNFRVNGGALNAQTCQTGLDGRCSVIWTSTVTGDFTINATIGTLTNHIKNSPADRTFTAGLANETTSTFLLEPGPKTVGQSFNMNATLRDRFGNAIPNQLVFYSVEPAIAGAGFGAVGVETDSENKTTGSIARSDNTFWSNIAGSYKITVRFGSATGPEISGSNQTAVFIPAPANQYTSNLTVTGAGPVDSAGGYYTVRAYAKDNIGPNAVPNVNFNIAVTNGTLSNGTLSGKNIVCTTNAAGYCEFLWSSPSEKGVFTVTAAFTNGTAISGSPQTREFISGDANTTNSQLVIQEAGPKTANGTDRYTAVITLRDGSNIPTAGSVLVSVTGGLLDGAYTSQSYGVDNTTGSVTLYWSSFDANNFTINASISGGLITNGEQVREFITGPVYPANSNFTITPFSGVTADNVSAYTLRVNIQDAYHNNRPGTVVTFNAGEGYLNNGTSAPKTIACTTDANGNCTVTWVSDKVGNFSVSALAGIQTIGQLQYRDFVQGAADITMSNLTVSPATSRIADNSTYFTAVARIQDALGHDVTGELITFSVTGGWIDNGTNKGTTLTCVTASGICTVYWKSDTPGNPTIVANITAGQVGTAQRQFIATNATAVNSTLEVTPGGPVTAGTGSYTAQVTAMDNGGVAAPGAVIQFTVSGGVLNSDSCETNSSGQCFVTWTSNQTGNFSINATIASTNIGGNGEALKASPQYRVFEADVPTADNSTLVITPATNTVVANSGNYYTLNITARDTHGNAVPNQTMNIYIGYGELNNVTDFPAGSFTSGNSSCLTNATGGCLVAWRSDKVGEYPVNVTIAGQGGVIYSSNEDKARRFRYGDVGEGNSYFTVTSYNISQPDNIPVCEESEDSINLCGTYYNINAYIEDNSSNAYEGANVTFRIFRDNEPARDAYLNDLITDGFHGNEAASYSCVMNATGRCSANITLKANIAGTYQIYASVGSTYIKGLNNNDDTKVERTFVAAKASNQTSQIHFNPNADRSVEADNVSYYSVTVEVLDAHSNPINATLVTLNVPATSWLDNSTSVSSSVSCVTAGSGNCSVLWRSVLADNPQTITAQVQNITLEGTRTFFTGAPSSNTSNITVSSHNITTDENVTVTVTVNDAKGNPIKEVNHNVVIYTSLGNSSFVGGTAGHTGTLTNVNGTYTAVLKSANIGNTTLTFTVDSVPSDNTEWVYFNSGKPDVNGSNNNSYIKAVSPVEVGNNSLVTVYIGDSNSNPIDNLSVTIYIVDNATNSSALINGSEQVTINGGTGGNYTANLTALNQGNVTVSFIVNDIPVNANDVGKNATVMFKTGIPNANNSDIYVIHDIDNTTNASADGVDYYTVTVIVKDAYNSTATNGIVIDFEVDKGRLSEDNNTLGAYQTIQCTTEADGSCKIYWMSEDWGSANITAYIDGDIVSGFPIERVFRRVVFDDNITIVDFAPSSKRVHVGDLVRYTVKIENNIEQDTVFRLNSLIPKGFSFVEGSIVSSTANGSINSTVISSHEFDAENLAIYSGGELTVVYVLRVGAGAKKGTHKSYVEAFKATESISNKASTEVEVTGDPMLDESLIFGTVYVDANANGMQDVGEMGIPGVRIATVEGYIITTDQFGRYHLLNILGGEWGIGRNFIMKVDESSLPKGSTFTTANPLLRRLTPGIPVRFDFGVKLTNEARSIETLMRSSAAEGGAQ
ncbi:MAG: Ig-like domain-containing protein [Campylobacteraceae bacterium]|jgi:adhesin/invasin|nr:Ig-like domain-containing protein [Campylobacteraceae bacterium]